MNRLAFQLYTCLRGTESEEENIKMTLCSALYRFKLIISDVDADFVWEKESIICAILIQQFMFPGDCSTKVSRQT